MRRTSCLPQLKMSTYQQQINSKTYKNKKKLYLKNTKKKATKPERVYK